MCGPQGRSGHARKTSATIGAQSSDRPARSQSLYRLKYPDSQHILLSRRRIFQYNIRPLKQSCINLRDALLSSGLLQRHENHEQNLIFWFEYYAFLETLVTVFCATSEGRQP